MSKVKKGVKDLISRKNKASESETDSYREGQMHHSFGYELTAEEEEELREAFMLFDNDGDEMIGPTEL